MRSQEREPHFVRAGAVEIHMDMSEEPFCMDSYRKSAGPQFRTQHFVWKFTGKKRTWTCHKSDFVWTFTEQMPHTLSGARILCGNLQEKTRMDMSRVTRAILCGNLKAKCRTRFPGRRFVRNLQEKTHGHVTRAILRGNF